MTPAHPALPPTTPIGRMAAAAAGCWFDDCKPSDVTRARCEETLADCIQAALTAARSAGFALVSVDLLIAAAQEIEHGDPDSSANATATALRQAAGEGGA